jgi:hypothetical protein
LARHSVPRHVHVEGSWLRMQQQRLHVLDRHLVEQLC